MCLFVDLATRPSVPVFGAGSGSSSGHQDNGQTIAGSETLQSISCSTATPEDEKLSMLVIEAVAKAAPALSPWISVGVLLCSQKGPKTVRKVWL